MTSCDTAASFAVGRFRMRRCDGLGIRVRFTGALAAGFVPEIELVAGVGPGVESVLCITHPLRLGRDVESGNGRICFRFYSSGDRVRATGGFVTSAGSDRFLVG
jgi:hypothetical protein